MDKSKYQEKTLHQFFNCGYDEDSESPRELNEKTEAISAHTLAGNKCILVASGPYLITTGTLGVLTMLLTAILDKDFGVNTSYSSFYFIALALFGSCSAFLSGYVVDRGYKWTVFVLGPLIGLLGMTLMPLSTSFSSFNHQLFLLVSLALIGTGSSLSFVATFVVIKSISRRDIYGTDDVALESSSVAGWTYVVTMGGKALGNIVVGGVAVDYFGRHVALLLQLVLLVAATCLAITSVHVQRTRS